MQQLWEKMEGLSKADKAWIKAMKLCRKFSGCHQMPERSFFIGDYQMPLCARCTGIVIGHITGVVVSIFHEVPMATMLATIPLMLDGTIQKLTSYESNNRKRIFTGILYGFSVMSTLINIAKKISMKKA